MVVRRLTKVHELLSMVQESTREMRRLKALEVSQFKVRLDVFGS